MRKIIPLFLVLMLFLALCACNEQESADEPNIHPDYVGEWTAVSRLSNGWDYAVITTSLKENGSATQRTDTKEVSGKWQYSQDKNQIILESNSGQAITLTPTEVNGHVVLKGAGAVYCRTDELHIVDITSENWFDYFEVKLTAAQIQSDDGEIKGFENGHYHPHLKEEYHDALVLSRIEFESICQSRCGATFTMDMPSGDMTFKGAEPLDAPLTYYYAYFTYNLAHENQSPEVTCDFSYEPYVDMFNITGNTATWEGSLWTDTTIKPQGGFLVLLTK